MEQISPPQLPLELIAHIAIQSTYTYRQLLALPPFARLTISKHRPYLLSGFVSVVSDHVSIKYYLGDNLHRDGDLPAIEYISGTKAWYQKGKLHRDNDQPAIEYANGDKYWYRKGNLHRDSPHGDLPAIEYASGDKEWYRNGKRHRNDDLPAVEFASGIKKWFRKGKLHRSNRDSKGKPLPAIIYSNGDKEFYQNDIMIR